MSQAVNRIRHVVKRHPGERLVALLQHVNRASPGEVSPALRKDASAGVDEVVWDTYAKGAEARLADLHDRMHSEEFRAPPSRRGYLPKENGGQPLVLGVAALEDKSVQKAVMDTVLEPIHDSGNSSGSASGSAPGAARMMRWMRQRPGL